MHQNTKANSITTMAFTGHRPNKLCGYTRELYKPFVSQLTEILQGYYDKGVHTFISGGAQGFDQLAFWAVHNLRKRHPDVKNIVYVPFKGQSDIWPDTGCFSKSDYNLMLRCATTVKYLLDVKPDAKKGMTDALMSRNHAMVNHSDIVLALQMDDAWEHAKYGGTAECMKYAKDHRKVIHRLSFITKPYLKITNCTLA